MNFSKQGDRGPLIIGLIVFGFLVGAKIKPMRLHHIPMLVYCFLSQHPHGPDIRTGTPLMIASSLLQQFPFPVDRIPAHDPPIFFSSYFAYRDQLTL